MTDNQLLEQAREITSRMEPHTSPWNESMSELASQYFQARGYSIDASMQMQFVADIVTDEFQQVSKYLEQGEKL